MRQWHVDPRLLCRQHLLGEHVEHHMLIGCLSKGKSIEGFIRDGLVAVHTIVERHDAVAAEMVRRGMNHKKPLPKGAQALLYEAGHVDPEANRKELARRCTACRERQEQAGAIG
jgi:hypothetical protein